MFLYQECDSGTFYRNSCRWFGYSRIQYSKFKPKGRSVSTMGRPFCVVERRCNERKDHQQGLTENDTAENKAKNRRVEVKVVLQTKEVDLYEYLP